MNYPLLLSSVGLLFALAVMERLAALALRADSARWRAHVARIPAEAVVTAQMWWNQGTWITAYLDEHSDRTGSLQVVALRPISSSDQAACFRWLSAEGFDELAISSVPPQRERRPRFDA